MAGMSVDGLITGLNTTDLVNQLLRAEAAPQAVLQTRLGATQQAAAAYRSLNTRVAALREASDALTRPGAWTPAAASSSSSSVRATASSGATAGSLTFSVVGTAARHATISAATWAAPTDAYGPAAIEVRNSDGTVRGTATVGGTGTLADAVAAVNGSSLGVTAAAVQVSPGQYRMQVTATASGAQAGFDVGAAGDFTVVTSGADALLHIGSGPGAYDVSSATNTFTDLLPGVTLTVSKPDTDVTVTVGTDTTAITASVQRLVDAANAALDEVGKHRAGRPGAVLTGDAALRRLTGQILDAVSTAVGGQSPASAGIELTKAGRLTFNATTFTDRLAADPGLAQRLVSGTGTTPGVAQRLSQIAAEASNTTTGTLTALASGRDSFAADLTTRIADWDRRLAAHRETLTRQFSAMETSLARLNSQSSWLAGQIKNLPS